MRALCDSGSQINLITNDCCQRLGLALKPIKISITGIGNTTPCRSTSYADVHMCARNNTATIVDARLIVVGKITSNLPSYEIENCFISKLKPDEFADPQYTIPGKIDVLLG